MRIISKFHDVYDSFAYGFTPDPKGFLWKRDNEVIGVSNLVPEFMDKGDMEFLVQCFKDIPKPFTYIPNKDHGVLAFLGTITLVFIGGKPLVVYEIFRRESVTKSVTDDFMPEYYTSVEDILKIRRNKNKNIKWGSDIFKALKDRLPFTQEALNEWYRKYSSNNKKKKFVEFHLKFKTPLLALRKVCWREGEEYENMFFHINPILKDLGVHKVMHVYEIYQEIAMFCDNVLVPQPKEPEPISDELKRDLHGMDEWSFKKKVR